MYSRSLSLQIYVCMLSMGKTPLMNFTLFVLIKKMGEGWYSNEKMVRKKRLRSLHVRKICWSAHRYWLLTLYEMNLAQECRISSPCSSLSVLTCLKRKDKNNINKILKNYTSDLRNSFINKLTSEILFLEIY